MPVDEDFFDEFKSFHSDRASDRAGRRFCWVPGPVCSERYRELAEQYGDDELEMSPFDNRPPLMPGPLGLWPDDPPSRLLAAMDFEPRGSATGSASQHPHPHQEAKERPIPPNVLTFVLEHYKDAQTLATQLGNGVTAAEVLAISGNESSWGDRRPDSQSKARFGNYFGLHGKGPAGTYPTKDNHTPTPKFYITAEDDGFKASGQVFVKLVKQKGGLTPGIGNDPKALFTALNKSHILANDHAEYADDMIKNDSKRGPYELVIESIEYLKREGKL
jgi:hypothetical protein